MQVAGSDDADDLAKKGTAYIDVRCYDGFEWSADARLTITVTFDGSIR